MTTKNVGYLGYGIVGGQPAEAQLFDNLIPNGVLIQPSSTGSSQVTGAGDGTYIYDITAGLVHVGGYIKEFAVAADQALETPADIMASGYSKVYAIIVWLHPETEAVALKVVPGTKALTGAQVAPTVAEIEATIHVGATWVHLANMTIARTGDTTVTEAVDNTVRPSLIPQSPNRGH